MTHPTPDQTPDPAPSDSAPTVPAVVCDLSGAPDTGEERLREYARLFDAAFVSRERTGTGMRWRLKAETGVEAWAKDLAARENACCAFMTNTVTTVGDQVLWEATTIDDPAARAVLDLFYELPDQRWAGVEEVHERWTSLTGVPLIVEDGTTTRPATVAEIRAGRGQVERPGND